MTLTLDNRTGVHNRDDIILNANEHEALDNLSRLNGANHTLLGLDRTDGWHLLVGGGPTYYVVTLDSEQETFTLKNKSGDPDKIISLCAGGQFGDFPENICVSQDQAKNAISLFFSLKEKQEVWI